MRQVDFLDAEIAAGRAVDRRRGAVLAGGQAADDRPRGQRDRRRDVHGRRRRHPPLPRPAQADRLSRPRSARPPVRRRARHPRPHLQAGLQQRPSRARGGVLVDGAPARPDRRLLSARPGAPRALDRDRRLRAQARVPVLVSAHPRRGLRLRAALADQEEDASPRAAGRRPAPAGRPRRLVDQRGDAPAERELALQAQRAYERTVKDWQQHKGASATPGRASQGSSKEHVARQTPRPKSAL